MTRNRQPHTLRPEEQKVVNVLERAFDGVTVEQHDDGSEDGQYDLDLTGRLRAAVEVGMLTDTQIRQANAHWNKHLEPHEVPELKRSWLFVFRERAGEQDRFPTLKPPNANDLTAVLVRLEARGIERVGRAFDYATCEHAGRRIEDPDIAELFRLLGPAAENASSVDLSHYRVAGGWSFSFGHGLISHADADRFAAEVHAILHDDSLADMRGKLDRSGQPVRIAALVVDSTTGTGWSTGHLKPGETPRMAIALPEEITHVLVLGMNDAELMYSATEGWTRLDAAVLPSA